jgi:hypothetical protein
VDVEAGRDGFHDAIAAGSGEWEGERARGSCAGHKLSAQEFVCTMKPDLDVCVREGEDLRGLGRTHLLKVAQDENGAICDGQRQD